MRPSDPICPKIHEKLSAYPVDCRGAFAACSLWAWTAWLARGFQKAQITRTSWAFGACLLVTYLGCGVLHVVWNARKEASTQSSGRSWRLRLSRSASPASRSRVPGEGPLPSLLGCADGQLAVVRRASSFRCRSRLAPGPEPPVDGAATGRHRPVLELPLRPERPLEFTFTRAVSHGRDSAVDVAMLGDSYVEGHLVSDDETCAVQLARLTGLTVGNFGQSGYGTAQEMRVLELTDWSRSPGPFCGSSTRATTCMTTRNSRTTRIPGARFQGPREKSKPLSSKWKFKGASFTVNAFLALRRAAIPGCPIKCLNFGWFKDDQGRRIRVFFTMTVNSRSGTTS